jgi:hypothetical protein
LAFALMFHCIDVEQADLAACGDDITALIQKEWEDL